MITDKTKQLLIKEIVKLRADMNDLKSKLIGYDNIKKEMTEIQTKIREYEKDLEDNNVNNNTKPEK